MSYGLLFKPRSGPFDPVGFEEYFRRRPHYRLEATQAWYENQDTGVYFHFDLQQADDGDEGEHYPVAFNINYFRPRHFIREAEPEVRAFIQHFDLLVADFQTNGMGEGEYASEKLLAGWDHGNELAFSVVLGKGEGERPNVLHQPTEVIERVWRWNLDRERVQSTLDEDKFVPLVMFFRLDGELVTGCVWPDGIPMVLPPVDVLCLARKQLAPRRLFRKVEDMVFVRWQDVLPVFQKFGNSGADGVVTLDYLTAPPEVAKFFRSFPARRENVSLVSAENVLNTELCQPYLD
ncbi:hypothetical protein [Arenimonas sp.]|uniref:hypothetical protein n=1 Tax=Arenimonas sp. TaxID=1872635 RepID=UPI0039E230D2